MTPTTCPNPRTAIGVIAIVVTLLTVVMILVTIGEKKEGPPPATSNIAAPPAAPEQLDYLSATTPITLPVEGWANIEVDAPILVYYPSETDPVRMVPGAPCHQMRAPKYVGPKRFVSEADPDNGHVSFRFYRMKRGC